MQAESRLQLRSDTDGIAPLHDLISRFGDQSQLPKEILGLLQISTDEIVSNIVRHGFVGRESWQIDIVFRAQDGVLEIEIVDDAPPFNPLEAAAPELGLSLESTQIGGLGIYIVKELTDQQEYRRESGKNRLILRKELEA